MILDQHGNPIETSSLTEDQTDNPATRQLNSEYCNHPSRGLTPNKLAGILVQAEQGDLVAQAELGEDIQEKDGHVFAELQKRCLAVTGLEWDIMPPRNATPAEVRATELVKEIITDMNKMDDIVLDMSAAIGYAYSNQEIEWQMHGKEWMPNIISYRPASWFTVDKETRTQILLRNNTGDGETLQQFGWISHIHKSKSGYLGRAGLFRILAWPYLFKNYSVRDLAEFLEIYGLPMRLGTYPSGTDAAGKRALLRAVVGIGHSAAGIIPQGMEIMFKDAADGRKDPFEFMMNWCESIQSKVILGGTLTSGSGGGTNTNALGNVHNECRQELRDHDAKQYAATLTRDLLYPMAALNAGVEPGRGPRFIFNTEDIDDVAVYSEALPKLVGVGMKIPSSWAAKKLGIPTAEENEEVLAVPVQATPTPVQTENANLKTVLNSAMVTLTNTAMPKSDVADNYIKQLGEVAPEALVAMFKPILDLVNNAESMDALQANLETLYPKMDEEELTLTLQQALVAADLAGRYEVIK